MALTPRLKLTYIDPAQAQKSVTVNTDLAELDALIQLSVINSALATPPGSPADGDCYIVAASPTGAWVGKANYVAQYINAGWTFYLPTPGWIAHEKNLDRLMVYNASSVWVFFDTLIKDLSSLTKLGVGTTATTTYPVTFMLNKMLATALAPGGGGTGDITLFLNKTATGNTAAVRIQDNTSAVIEFGAITNDSFTVRMSTDGSTFTNAIVVDQTTADVDVMSKETTVASAATSDIGATKGLRAAISGSATITSLGAVANRIRFVRSTGTAVLTYNATSLVLPGLASITMAAGDAFFAGSDGSGNWTVYNYIRAATSPNLYQTKIERFTANGTYTRDNNYVYARVRCVGPGGPGAGGCMAAAATACSGGGGGGGGAIMEETFSIADLTSTVAVTVPASPAGGTGAASLGAGGVGTAAADTTFGAYLTARHGGAASGGAAGAVSAGGGGAGTKIAGGDASGITAGVAGSGGGGAGGSGASNALVSSGQGGSGGSGGPQSLAGTTANLSTGGCTGGAAGGGIDTSNVFKSGGFSNEYNTLQFLGGSTAGANGASQGTITYGKAAGGGGGASGISVAGGNGGAGGNPGGGGGGGGAGQSPNAGGNGGAGGRGECLVISFR